MVEFTRRVMSDERGAMSSGNDKMPESVETMMTADGLQLAAHSLGEPG